MSSLYFVLDIFFLFEARAPEFDVVYPSTGVPVFQGESFYFPVLKLWPQIGRDRAKIQLAPRNRRLA
jgi:hypothetical protein